MCVQEQIMEVYGFLLSSYLLNFLYAKSCLQEFMLVEHFCIGSMCSLHHCVQKT